MMDVYIAGALLPYNHLSGGKPISYILASREVRCIYKEKYKDRVTLISGKKRNKWQAYLRQVCLVTVPNTTGLNTKIN